MMSNSPSPIVLIARIFGFNFVGSFLISLFWNTLSGLNMFPLDVVFWVAVVLIAIFMGMGWAVVTGGCEGLLKDDPKFQGGKKGGRPYLDSSPWPIKPASPDDQKDN